MAKAQSRVVSREALLGLYGPTRDEVVVFTNGVFDLLHPGHVEYLGAARALGDRLVVGVNTDASARRLGKGPNRPVQAEADRAAVVAALRAVDHVCLFDEDTPTALIRALGPDVLVKGGDYVPAEVAGREVVEAYGGRLVILPFADGHSSSDIIQRIRGRVDG